ALNCINGLCSDAVDFSVIDDFYIFGDNAVAHLEPLFPLEDATKYVVTFDNNLLDVHRATNELRAPKYGSFTSATGSPRVTWMFPAPLSDQNYAAVDPYLTNALNYVGTVTWGVGLATSQPLDASAFGHLPGS